MTLHPGIIKVCSINIFAEIAKVVIKTLLIEFATTGIKVIYSATKVFIVEVILIVTLRDYST